MKRLSLVTVGAASLLLLGGCSNETCERNALVDVGATAGDCSGAPTGHLLGDDASCRNGIDACSDADQAQLRTIINCFGQTQVCSAATADRYQAALASCARGASELSQPCYDAFFSDGVPGGGDGTDGGSTVDAGPDPITDGGNGVELVAAVDGTDVAFAWSQKQPGPVSRWQLLGRTRLEERDPEIDLGGASVIDFFMADAGIERHRFFVVGRDEQGEIARGVVETAQVDAGVGRCNNPLDCAPELVCDLGQCRAQACSAQNDTCPTGYQCYLDLCHRVTSDGGTFDAGQPTTPTERQSLPFVSNLVEVEAGPASFSATSYVGAFPARRPAIAAADTARVLVSVEQESSMLAHASSRRGRDLPSDALTAFSIDTVGAQAKATYNPEGKRYFVCYSVGRGVRVQASADFGRTWGTSAVTFEPDADAGLSSIIQDCAVAPWREGGVMLTTIEDEGVVVRALTSDLQLTSREVAFAPNPAGYFGPVHPAIATVPADHIVHITFSASRLGSGSTPDMDPVGIYRDGTLGTFTEPQCLSGQASGIPNAQDWTTVAIDAATGRALAAFVSVEPAPDSTPISTVYTALWNPQQRKWASGSDLNVFVANQNTSLLFPNKAPATDVWHAFSPSVVVLPSGKLWLTFAVGPRGPLTGDYRMVAVAFDFDLQSPLGTSRGWYVRPVTQVSDTRVLAPRIPGGTPLTPVSALAADRQLSIYGVFIEGLGANGDQEGRAVYFSRP